MMRWKDKVKGVVSQILGPKRASRVIQLLAHCIANIMKRSPMSEPGRCRKTLGVHPKASEVIIHMILNW